MRSSGCREPRPAGTRAGTQPPLTRAGTQPPLNTVIGTASVGGFLEDVARGTGPSAGAVVATTVGASAALAALAAATGGSDELVARCDGARRRALELADEDVAAYRRVRDAGDATARNRALVHATEIPLSVAELAGAVAGLAERAAAVAGSAARPDAVAAAHLADASVRAATELVVANTAVGRLDDALVRRAREQVAQVRKILVRVGPG